jgi:hypothetical protein
MRQGLLLEARLGRLPIASTQRRKRNQGFCPLSQVVYHWKTLVSYPLVYLRRRVLVIKNLLLIIFVCCHAAISVAGERGLNVG